jgi:hypothetical protein
LSTPMRAGTASCSRQGGVQRRGDFTGSPWPRTCIQRCGDDRSRWL